MTLILSQKEGGMAMVSDGTALLEFAGTVTVSATNEPFVAGENFVTGTGLEGQVKISWVGVNFRERFLGKVEEPLVGTTFRYAKLAEFSLDGPILNELGDQAEATLGQVYRLMSLQPHGEKGALLTNGHANIFYMPDGNNELCAVHIRWHGFGWYVHAGSASIKSGWPRGSRVFSRNSSGSGS